MKRSTFFMGCMLIACGGADQTSLDDDSGQAADQQSPDGSQPADASADNTVAPDASVDAPILFDAVTVDVPIKPADSKIQCGTAQCSAQNEICCYHVGSTIKQYECVASLANCAGQNDVPVSCSGTDNCASQGNPSFICCAEPDGPENPAINCNNFTGAASVACKATCDPQQNEFQVGCSVQLQDCVDTQATCGVSTCSLPGFDICR